MRGPSQGGPQCAGEEWGHSRRGRHPHLSCSLPPLGFPGKGALCSARTRPAIEAGQGMLWGAKDGWKLKSGISQKGSPAWSPPQASASLR